MGNSASVFPKPVDPSTSVVPPNWAIAVVAAAAGVTLLWIIAIFILILFELLWRGQRKSASRAGVPTLISESSKQPPNVSGAIRRDTSTNSLGTPPPPITAPSHYATLRPADKGLAVDATDGQDMKEFRLRVEDKEGSEEIASLYSQDSFTSDLSKEECVKPVMSESVRSDSAAAPMTSIDGSTGQDPPLAGMVLSRPVTVRQLGATIKEPGYIESEFRKLPTLSVAKEELPAGTERKNRYTNVLPTPRTRVELPQIFGHSNSDYINANFIRGYMGSHGQYIATQGPLESTVEDFWRMILDNKTAVIIMATNFQERGIDKCTRYWPAQGSEEYGSVQVTLVQQTAHGTYNSSILQVQASGGTIQLVTHYRFTFWPTQGVPKDTKTLTDFLRSVKMADCSGPAVVHCSSGIGRTGVLLACDIAMQGLLQGDPKVDVLRTVSTLRQDRAGMVQTREQYRFIHEALYAVAIEEYTK